MKQSSLPTSLSRTAFRRSTPAPVAMGIRLGTNKLWPETVRQARRLIVLVVGLTLLLCGVVMLVTPGPGSPLILAGLSLLALEFVWARRLLKTIKAKGYAVGRTMFDSRKK